VEECPLLYQGNPLVEEGGKKKVQQEQNEPEQERGGDGEVSVPQIGEGEKAYVEQIDFQTVLSDKPQRPAQPTEGELFKEKAEKETERDGGEEKEMAEGEKPVFRGSDQIESPRSKRANPEYKMERGEFSVLMDEAAQQETEKKDGDTVENVHQPPPVAPDQELAEEKGEQNGKPGGENGSFGPLQTAETQGGDGIEGHNARYIPVKGAL